MIVLAVNVGSSTLKLSLHDIGPSAPLGDYPDPPLWEANHVAPFPDMTALVAAAKRVSDARTARIDSIQAVGHRVVHGGATLSASTRITSAVCDTIAGAGTFAPVHNALELEAIAAAERVLGLAVPQVAVFDTAFHATLSPTAYTYAGPSSWIEQGIRRYGFHGVSHSYASARAARLMQRAETGLRVVTCHLGSGCSLAAVRDGRSVDTTMGFTPLDGVVMATRSGAVDPGILLHLLRHGETAESLDVMLNRHSGLAGLSGLSGDMRELLGAAGDGSARARLALDVYVHRLRQGIASMTASMGGLDGLVFTGGVGEHSAQVRGEVCAGLAYLGIRIDASLNDACGDDDAVISPGAQAVAVLVVHARENFVIAREAAQVSRISDSVL